MKKIILLLLVCCTVFTLCFSSCKRSQNGEIESDISSEITYYEDSSTIAKTETDGNFTFAFDPYVLPEDVKKALGGTSLYKRFADAVIEREETVSMPSRDDYDNIRFAIGENFPFAFLISGYKYDSANNQILISYNYEQTHNSKMEDFENAVGQVFDSCVVNSDDDVIAALSLYNWLAHNIEIEADKISDTNFENGENVSSGIASDETSSEIADDEQENDFDIYSTLINKKGSSDSVSALYNFLLMQLGIECKTVSCWEGNQYHTWNMICLNSKWYHCDISAEQKETDGTGLKFFGMNTDRLSQYITAEEIYTGEWTWFTNDIPAAKSDRFEDFANVVSWEVASDRNAINAFTEEYSRFVFKI